MQEQPWRAKIEPEEAPETEPLSPVASLFRERFEQFLPTIQREWPDVARHTLEATRGSLDTVVEVIARQTGRTSEGEEGTILFYGAQVEQGSYPTSYIPTYGSSATRSQDQASFTHDAATTSWSVFMDVKNWTDVSNSGQFFFRNIADTSNSLFYYGACFGIQKSVGQEYSCGKLSNYEVYNGKFAVTYDGVNTIKIYVDGVLRDTITIADTAKTAGIDGGNLYYAGSSASKEIKSLLVFPTALTYDECIALTAL